MVWNDVEDDLESALMRLFDEEFGICKCAKERIDIARISNIVETIVVW